jgi:sugar phosphate isomerase/epimerase
VFGLFADRLCAVHLHDNNGYDDQHRPVFSGTADWKKLAAVISASKYAGPPTLEVGIRNSGIGDEMVFLRQMYADSGKFAGMIMGSQPKVI